LTTREGSKQAYNAQFPIVYVVMSSGCSR